MGFFSWLDAETGVSIRNRYVENPPAEPVYMLDPGGAPLEETCYRGYGMFGGVDAFAHLARTNLPASTLDGLDDEGVREVGCALDEGYYERVSDGTRHQFGMPAIRLIDPTVTVHAYAYDVPIAAFDGATANQMIEEGRLVERAFDVAHPLKFSHRRDADYHALAPSPRCPDQGCL
jgi:hypothetical protein